jgi:ankyrin repeat protein
VKIRILTVPIVLTAFLLSLAALAQHKGIEEPEPEGWLESVYDGDLDAVTNWIYSGVEVNEKDENEYTPLMWAVLGDHAEIVRLLVDYGAAIDGKGWFDLTALHLASSTTSRYDHTLDPSVARLLVDLGATVDVRDQLSMTPLMHAAEDNQLEIVQMLIEAGASVNTRDAHGMTALMYASKNCHPAVVRALLEAGAKVNMQQLEGYTPLMFASASGYMTKRHFIERGYNERARSTAPETVELLLNAGAEVNTTDLEGRTALWWAIQRSRNYRVKRLLTDAGAESLYNR